MRTIAEGLAEKGITVVRFNFPYMVQMAATGKRRPPDRQEKLLACYRQVVEQVRDELGSKRKLYIGGKSMGGRMASLIADEIGVYGLVCLGYPFHPPGKPERLRTEHLLSLNTSALFCQGERDPFGRREEVESYDLSGSIKLYWLLDGEHSFKPRKSSGRTESENLSDCIHTVAAFMNG